jgi:beta-phosphoglucomutase
MTFHERFRAVLFDLDGVLTDTAHYHYIAWKQLAEELDIRIDEAFNERLKGVDRMSSLRLILAHGGITRSVAEQEQLAKRKNDHYVTLIASMTAKDLLPGAIDRLQELRSLDVRIGLASASRNAPMVLRCLGIESMIDTIADPAAVKAGKPAPDIFLLAAAQLHVSPRQCLGVEDALAGIEAIHAAGMLALGIGDPKTLAQADLVKPDLACFRFADLKF